MKLSTTAFADHAPIPAEFAFGKPDRKTHVTLSDNRNPDLAWSEAPPGTRSFAVVCHDPDVPSRGDDVNQEGRSISASLPRVDFYHWVLIDVPAETTSIRRGSHSEAVTPRGKSGPEAPGGGRHAVNDYTGWFASDETMAGDYHGYDGPCPPWNDEIPHRYVFTVYALDVASLDVPARFTPRQALDAMQGHILAKASVTGRYTLNPEVQL